MSTLPPTETLPVLPGPGSGWNPEAETVWNFCHQVGWLYVRLPALVPAVAGSAQPATTKLRTDAAAKTCSRLI